MVSDPDDPWNHLRAACHQTFCRRLRIRAFGRRSIGTTSSKGGIVNDLQDIEVVMTFLRTEEGGRKSPAFSGYRPQFYYQGKDWDAQHTCIGVEQVNPGDTVTAQVKFLSPQFHVGKIAVGMEFQIRERNRTVATGRVTKILNLEENAARIPPTQAISASRHRTESIAWLSRCEVESRNRDVALD